MDSIKLSRHEFQNLRANLYANNAAFNRGKTFKPKRLNKLQEFRIKFTQQEDLRFKEKFPTVQVLREKVFYRLPKMKKFVLERIEADILDKDTEQLRMILDAMKPRPRKAGVPKTDPSELNYSLLVASIGREVSKQRHLVNIPWLGKALLRICELLEKEEGLAKKPSRAVLAAWQIMFNTYSPKKK